MGEALDHLLSLSGHDLIFFEKRSTPLVVATGAAPDSNSHYNPELYGAQTKRRKATADEEKTIARGDWVRVDQSGTKGGQPGYKRTRMKGRQHLLDAHDKAQSKKGS